jgi:hypothetical protein
MILGTVCRDFQFFTLFDSYRIALRKVLLRVHPYYHVYSCVESIYKLDVLMICLSSASLFYYLLSSTKVFLICGIVFKPCDILLHKSVGYRSINCAINKILLIFVLQYVFNGLLSKSRYKEKNMI